MVIMLLYVYMLGYITTASAVNSVVPGGKGLFHKSRCCICDCLGFLLAVVDLPIVAVSPPTWTLVQVGCDFYLCWLMFSVLDFGSS